MLLRCLCLWTDIRCYAAGIQTAPCYEHNRLTAVCRVCSCVSAKIKAHPTFQGKTNEAKMDIPRVVMVMIEKETKED